MTPLQLAGRSWRSLGDLAGRQLPGPLFLERQREQLAYGQLLLIAERRHADGDLCLRNIAPETAMNFVPPAKDRAPVRIGLALDDGMMDAVHPRRDDDVIQDALEA